MTEQKEIPQVAVVGEKPKWARTEDGNHVQINPAMRIFNTTRPLWGDVAWSTNGRGQGFRDYGWWFAAVHPNSSQWQECYDYNRRMDAYELIFVTETDAFIRGVTILRQQNADKAEKWRIPEHVLQTYIEDPDKRNDFIMRGLRAMSTRKQDD